MTRYFDLHSTVLIVVGHGLLPEEEDRPIAYELKRLVNTRAGGADGRAAVVVTDFWIMNNELGDFFPAIALGGPGVNGFTAQIYEDLPVAFTHDDRVFVQVAEAEKRAGYGEWIRRRRVRRWQRSSAKACSRSSSTWCGPGGADAGYSRGRGGMFV